MASQNMPKNERELSFASTYAIVVVVLVIEMAGVHVVPTVPIHIGQASVVSLVLHDCLSSDAETILVLVLTVAQLVSL